MKNIICLILLLLSFHVYPDSYRYRIYLKDKPGYDNIDIKDFLSEKSLERRDRFNIAIDEADYPVSSEYINTLVDDGFTVICKSKWMNSIVVETEEEFPERLYNYEFADSVKTVWYKKTVPGKALKVSDVIKEERSLQDFKSDKYYQLKMHNADLLHNDGFRGKGITIAILDAGFMNVDKINTINQNIIGTKDFPSGDKESVFQQNPHGTNVLSILAYKNDGEYSGSAPDAEYLLIRTEDTSSEFPIEEDYWIAGAEYADSVGVDIITSSLGYFNFDDNLMNYYQSDLDGETAFITRGASIAADKGLLLVNSAGNEGTSKWMQICFPSDCKKAITVGSVNADSTYSGFSSKGFVKENNYIKPDVTGMGYKTWYCDQKGALVQGSGTSYSTPIIAGLAACLWQAFPNLTPEEIKKVIINNSSRVDNPDEYVGNGIPNVYKVYSKEQEIVNNDKMVEYSYVNSNEWNVRITGKDDIYPAVVLSSNGSVVKRDELMDGDNLLNLDSLYSGVYVICVQIDEERVHKLIVIE